jgi:predicted dehydrogenase
VASENVNVAVIGCGYWGKNLARNFFQLGALSAVCDATPAGRQTAAEVAPTTPVVADLEDVLRSDVPGVVIATPAETHYEIARRALAAGKDVFVEKPLALTYDQGSALARLADEANAILMVGHVLEYHPAIVRMLELVRTGELGKVHYISSNRLNLGKVRREENILWSFAPHDIAIILRLMGSMPFQVTAHGGSYVQPNIADVTITHMLFDNNVRAHIYVSWLHPFKEQRLVVIGSKKMASYDDVSKHLVLYDQRVEVQEGQPVPIRGNGDLVEFAADEPLRLECQAFLDAIATREPPVTDGYSGLRVLQVLQSAQRSLVMNGEPVTLSVENFSERGTLIFS